jgi:hypothetical protein
LLEAHPGFRSIASEHTFGQNEKHVADLLTERQTSTGWQKLLIEVKRYSSFSEDRLIAIIRQLKMYQPLVDADQLALAFLGRLTDKDNQLLQSNGIEVWDIKYISNVFRHEIETVTHAYFQRLFKAISAQTLTSGPEDLLERLRTCPPGREHWRVYQRLVTDILEELFCPPLNSPITELTDEVRVNRRDIILPNYSTDGFWKFMQDKYTADYIVVDAKNYVKPVGKEEALQVANYLKLRGAGLFGIIISRQGGDDACYHILREQWMDSGKLILVLNDRDVASMLLAHRSGGRPEEVISQKIEEFRLAL